MERADAAGAGAATQRAVGTSVFGGMLASARVGILLIPGLYVIVQTLREKIKGLESHVAQMIRHSQDNLVIAGKLQSWTRSLLQTAQAGELPGVIVQGLVSEFQIPQAAIKVWGVGDAHADAPFARDASGDVQAFAAALTTPYCGPNAGFEAAGWLPEPAQVQSLALIALRTRTDAPVSGLLVLASPDGQRFHSGMGTDFLENLGALAGAALSRLHAPVVLAAS